MFDKLATTLILSMLTVLLGMLLFSFAGCEEAPPPPPRAAKIEKTEPPPATEEEEAESEAEEEEAGEEKEPEFTYDGSNRREPFKTLVAEELPTVDEIIATPTPGGTVGALQKFEVKQLKLKGVILGGLGDYAKVEAPDGKSYTIDVGTFVGMHGGAVISIRDNAVIVKETIRYESGKEEDVETSLYLNPIEEEGNL